MQEGTFCNLTFIFYFLLVLGSSYARMLQSEVDDKKMIETNKDPSLNVFFTPNDLQLGKRMPIFFPIKNISEIPKPLPKKMADKIPFSVTNLSYLLHFFSISKDSPQAKAMEYTLTQCELEPMEGETKFCATSFESLYRSTRGFFGSGSVKAEATVYPKNFKTELQNYTILEEPIKIWAPRILSCHLMPYPYLVLYCHSQVSDNILYKVILEGENGDRVKSVAICHIDTSEWDSDHVVFRVLNVEPGASSVCHFYPRDNIVFVSDV
ncbi:BURP domain-containing protein BNM2A-like [Benincasa hispida]|uniref:BURP domain-containing protein BNM2A-like n=1 Tax=Benincasa hispida TaxID=102211 RepID=UPI0019017993|nr:BURP domain-containing protein BNM2A-like [Benincasa hispida]